jgi:hypothetical protein
MGLYMGLAQAGMSAASTFAQFSPEKGAELNFSSGGGGGASNFQYGGSQQAFGSGLDLGALLK